MENAGRILIMPKGAYDPAVTYEMLDLVPHNGSAWLAKKTVTGIEPSNDNAEYWMNMCEIDKLAEAAALKMYNAKLEELSIYGKYESGANYAKLPDGTLICYGDISIPEGQHGTSIVFQEAFANGNVAVTITNHYEGDGAIAWSTANVTKAGATAFVVDTRTGTLRTIGEKNASYMAIGRWK
ncbi:MAG: hypothetical protein IJB80_05495 [Clostridia bacterium]|nr:hypothetical protein [Clostridia bacterium]